MLRDIVPYKLNADIDTAAVIANTLTWGLRGATASYSNQPL